jgi:hypothetical protein
MTIGSWVITGFVIMDIIFFALFRKYFKTKKLWIRMLPGSGFAVALKALWSII